MYYFLFSFFLIIIWAVIFTLRKNLRKEMLIGSLLVTPMAFTEPFFVPSYWKPDSIINHPALSIEDFLFCWAIGGIIAVCYELVMRGTVRHYRLHHSLREESIHILIILSGGIVLFGSYFIFQIRFMQAVYLFMIFEIITVGIFRRDLISKIIYSGIIFGTFYCISFLLFLFLFSRNFISMWNMPHLSGIFFLGIPAEEIVWSFLAGAVAAPLYEFILSFELIKPSKSKNKRKRK